MTEEHDNSEQRKSYSDTSFDFILLPVLECDEFSFEKRQGVTVSDSGICQHEQVHNLYNDHHSWLYAWLCKKVGCSHNASDIAQNTFLRLLTTSSLPQIKEPRGFLTTTANRLIIDESRRKYVEQQYLENYYYYHGEQAVAPSSEDIALITEKLTAVVRLLESLPENCRSAFLMNKFEGKQYAEIAAELGVSKSMVQQYMIKVKLAYYDLTYSDE